MVSTKNIRMSNTTLMWQFDIFIFICMNILTILMEEKEGLEVEPEKAGEGRRLAGDRR